MNDYYVYILKCSDGSFYVGITNDLERRVGEHQYGWNPACYTHERRPVRLVYSERFSEVDAAIAWEKRIKGWSRKKKIALIMGDFEKIHEVDREQHGRSVSS
ncbi:MAG: GIY-YIG nuclease family protein [Candidatus Eremiobacteraeota bacterium]|nr:GIY-YIG nuclease family protein [Candidatus Eremiobacteraeota bacterium]